MLVRSTVLAMVVMLAVAGCNAKTTVVTAPVVESDDPVEGMVFLSFIMEADSVRGKSITLVSKTIVPQKLKANPADSDAPNRIRVSQLTGSGTLLSTVSVDHPLYRRFEFADDRGEFRSKEVILAGAEFFVRVTLYRQTAYIRVEEALNGAITYTTNFNLRD